MADAPDTKAKPDVKTTAQKDAADIVNKDHHEGAQGAYAALKKDFDEHTKGMSADDKSAYWKTMNDSLSKAGVLPDLAVAWGKDAVDGGKYGDGKSLTVGDLNTVGTLASRNSDAQSQMDAAFAKNLKDQITDPKNELSHHDDAWFQSGKSVDAGAFKTAFDAQQKQIAHEKEQETNRNDMAPLMDHNGKLFKSLDTAAHGGSPDGKISSNDMDSWLAAADKERQLNGSLPQHADANGNPVVNEDNYNYIKSLRDGSLKGFKVDGIDMGKLAEQGGFSGSDKDIDGAISEFNKKHAGDSGVAPDGSTTTTDAQGNKIKKEPLMTTAQDGDYEKYTVTNSDGSKTSTVNTKDGNPTDVTTPDGGHYTKGDDGKWTAAADSKDGAAGGKKDFGFDANTGTLTYTGGDGKHYSQAADGTTKEVPATAPAPDASAGKTVHDANGADVTRDASGNVTDIKYPAGSDGVRTTAHFDYDTNGKLKDFTGEDGQKFTTSDGGKTFKAPDGTTAKDVSVDKTDGTIHYTDSDGHKVKVGTDGIPKADDGKPAPTSDAAHDAARKELEQLSAQEAGKGPYHAAEKILGPGASQADINALTKLLKQNWQETHGDPNHKNDSMKGLEPGYQFLNDKNFQAILDKSPALKAKYEKNAATPAPVDYPDD